MLASPSNGISPALFGGLDGDILVDFVGEVCLSLQRSDRLLNT